jgi:hypothetical protein
MMRGCASERGEVSLDARVRMGRRCKTDTLLDHESRECVRAKPRWLIAKAETAKLLASSGF